MQRYRVKLCYAKKIDVLLESGFMDWLLLRVVVPQNGKVNSSADLLLYGQMLNNEMWNKKGSDLRKFGLAWPVELTCLA